MFKVNAGQMRGFRVVRDPESALFEPFDWNGQKYGYIITYGEGTPAIHNGEEWVSVLENIEDAEWDEKLQSLLVEQGTKITTAAATSHVYAELATQMGLMATVAAPVVPPANSDPADEVTYFGA
jgi:hypothetical protein